MRERFKELRFNGRNEALIFKCNDIARAYQADNLRLTLRQMYYQLVSRNIITNTERSYQNLSTLLSKARLAGELDWDVIEDRTRRPRMPLEYTGLKQLVQSALYSYRLPRWEGQDHYVELWVEKDALAGVLQPIASEYHVALMVNRGYSSQSAMYAAYQRFQAQSGGRELTLLYLGDHDPSGEDMVRDIKDRLDMFGVDVTVIKVALTMKQVRQYKPPPNPAKMSDSRAGKYVKRHGNQSWEVDALNPRLLRDLIVGQIMSVLDQDKVDRIKTKEERDKKKLRKALKSITEPKKRKSRKDKRK